MNNYPPYLAPEIEDIDVSVAQYGLEPSDVQPHVIVSRTYYGPIVSIQSLDNVDPDQLRAEILMASYAAEVRYRELPADVRAFDKKVIDEAFIYQNRLAEKES